MGTSNHRIWSADYEVHSMFTDGERVLGLVVKNVRTVSGEPLDSGWDALDMTSLNSSRTGARNIGHFKTRKAAKRSVEKYWQTIDKSNGRHN